MSNLNELVQYEAGIYQLETTDPVLGGPDGIDNLQAKQLANRTAYLKQHVDALEAGTGVGGLVPPGIATQDYVAGELNKRDNKQSARVATTGNIALNAVQVIDGVNVQVGDRVLVKNQIDATQNGIYVVAAGGWTRALDADENVDVTAGMEVMVTEGALQADTAWKLTTNDPINLGVSLLSFADITTGYAPLNSPVLTGDPTAPTPVQFDNDNSLATTAFVKRQGLQSADVRILAGTTALGATDAGKTIIGGSAAAFTVTMPAANSVPPGGRVEVFNVNAGVMTLQRAGTDTLNTGSQSRLAELLGIGDSMYLVSNGIDRWYMVGGSIQLRDAAAFGASKAASGWQKLPSGLIIQWGVGNAGQSGANFLNNFPLAFPTGVFAIFANHLGNDASVNIIVDSTLTLTQFGLRSNYTPGAVTCYFFAVGN